MSSVKKLNTTNNEKELSDSESHESLSNESSEVEEVETEEPKSDLYMEKKIPYQSPPSTRQATQPDIMKQKMYGLKGKPKKYLYLLD